MVVTPAGDFYHPKTERLAGGTGNVRDLDIVTWLSLIHNLFSEKF